MPRRSRREAARRVVAERRAGPTGAFVELVRPSAGRELVLEVEQADGVRVRLTLRDGGLWRFAGLEGPARDA